MQKRREQEFLKAYDDYADDLFRHAFFRVRDRERAKDLVQETFTRTWTALSGGATIDNLRAFFYRVLTNAIIDESRKKKAASLDTMLEEGFAPRDEEATEAVLEVTIIRETHELLSTLPDEYRLPLIMRHLDGLSPREIAEVLGLTENLVSVRINRAINKLRKNTS
ncbi:MAG TPA: RNA polymerase sigma factor [Candidatus Paceibacterota bacterium]|nr:RNA polymerase sigma factor [Candidatus Paceibacterota bacterium]